MKIQLWKLSVISFLSLANIACSGGGGSSSNPTNPPAPTDSQFELNVKLSGLNNESVSFDWLGKKYSINSGRQITATAAKYSNPTDIVFPDTHQCSSEINKLTDSNYELLVVCESKVVDNFSSILIDAALPYAVRVKLDDQIFTIKDHSIETQINTSSTPIVLSSDGPLLCDFTQSPQQSTDWRLACEEFVITSEQTTDNSGFEAMLISQNKRIPLGLTATTQPQNIAIHTVSSQSFFIFNNSIYSLKIDNGSSVTPNLFSGSFFSLVSHNDTLYSLASDGLYKFIKTDGTWLRVRPISQTVASPLFSSNNTLSWITRREGALVLDRFVSDSNKPSTNAAQQATEVSDHGAMSIQNGVFWLARDAANQWIFTAIEVMNNPVNQVIQTLNKQQQFALWQVNQSNNKLLMIEGDNILSFDVENQSMTWRPYKTTSADLIASHQDLLVTASQLSQSQAEITALYKGDSTLDNNQLIEHFNLASSPIIALRQESTAFSNITLEQGFLLFYIEGEGDVWITDGTIENSKKIFSNKSWQEFTALKIVASGASVLLLNNSQSQQDTLIYL